MDYIEHYSRVGNHMLGKFAPPHCDLLLLQAG